MTNDPLPFSVEEWGAHPDDDDDCCWETTEFATFKEAQKELAHQLQCGDTETVCYILCGPALREIHRNPTLNKARAQRQAAAEHAAWRREIAMETGMLHGVDAYNDAMGQSLEPPEDQQ